MNRTQFTFYESFYRSISRIKKATDRVKAYDVLCEYALYGKAPALDSAPDSVASFFEANRAILDSAAKKSAAGRKGGSSKQAKASQKQSETDGSGEEASTSTRNRTSSSARTNVIPPDPLPGVSPQLQAAFTDWLAYKAERKEDYKPTGLKALETEVLHNASLYGDEAVASLIRTCMASNWRGIIFDRLREGKPGGSRKPENGFQTSNPFLEMLEEELSRNGQS